MRKTFLLFTLIGIFTFVKAQIVNIPDAKFKLCLIMNYNINTNHDFEIQVSEALAYTGAIDCSYMDITDLTGIESFVNITSLDCSVNKLKSLDVSKNTALKILYCANNSIGNLDVSKNTALENLGCISCKLTNLDLSKNIALKSLTCGSFNQFTNLDTSKNISLETVRIEYAKVGSLDFSKNTALIDIVITGNGLTSLNLKNGNNSKIVRLAAYNNSPNLTCIQVDDVAYANSQSNWRKDVTASYNTNCLLSTNEIEKLQIKIYPNPAKDSLNFSQEVSNIRISDHSGKVLKQISNSEKSINISKLAKGNYIISVTTKTGETVNKKFIKE